MDKQMDKQEVARFINLAQALNKAKQQELYLMIKGAAWAEQNICKRSSNNEYNN